MDIPHLPKSALIDGQYYYGRCRNANVAKWRAKENDFIHWRTKFGLTFTEEIRHPEDELRYDVFYPVREATADEISSLPGEL